jgi:hypothetical protein
MVKLECSAESMGEIRYECKILVGKCEKKGYVNLGDEGLMNLKCNKGSRVSGEEMD